MNRQRGEGFVENIVGHSEVYGDSVDRLFRPSRASEPAKCVKQRAEVAHELGAFLSWLCVPRLLLGAINRIVDINAAA